MRAREGGRDRGRGRAPGRDYGRGGEQVREQDRGRDQGRDRGRGRDLDRGRRGGRGGDRGRRPMGMPQRPQGPAMKTPQAPEAAGLPPPAAAPELVAETVSAETVVYLPPPGDEAAPSKAASEAPGEVSNREGPSETAGGESGFDPHRQRPGRGRRRGRRGGRGRGRGRGGPRGPGGPMGEDAAPLSGTGERVSSDDSTLAGRDDEASQRLPRDTSDSSEGNE